MKVENTIYLDHQATTPIDPKVVEAMQPLLSNAFGNPHSSEHFLGWQASKFVEKSRSQIASAIGADDDEIIFTSGATEANNLAIFGALKRYVGPRKKILVSTIEHKCILVILRILQEQYGFEVEYIPVNHQGVVDLEWLESNLDNDVLLVSVMAVNNEVGSIQPLEKIANLASNVGAFFHSDAAQALCAIDMDVDDLAIDFLSLSAHKIYGPKGIGAVFIRRDHQKYIEPVIYGGGQENNLRGGTLPVPLCVGMGMAIELQQELNIAGERQRLNALRNFFVRKVLKLNQRFTLNGPDLNARHPGNANICFTGYVAQNILTALQPRLAASTGSACSSGIIEPSYVLRELGLNFEDAESSIRFSLGRYTTEKDVDEAVILIRDVLERLG